jgi:hypothetical protein
VLQETVEGTGCTRLALLRAATCQANRHTTLLVKTNHLVMRCPAELDSTVLAQLPVTSSKRSVVIAGRNETLTTSHMQLTSPFILPSECWQLDCKTKTTS